MALSAKSARSGRNHAGAKGSIPGLLCQKNGGIRDACNPKHAVLSIPSKKKLPDRGAIQ